MGGMPHESIIDGSIEKYVISDDKSLRKIETATISNPAYTKAEVDQKGIVWKSYLSRVKI